jgi:hypothetical protein
MDQSIETNPDEKLPDVRNCLVHRIDEGIEVCMVNTQCDYALPFGNLCAHPSASQIADWAPRLK